MANPEDIPIGDTVQEDFYIGYLAKSPISYAKKTWLFVAVLILIIPTVSILAALNQKEFNNGRFEFGVLRDFEGIYLAEPVPRLYMQDTIGGEEISQSLLLVGFGKFKVPDQLEENSGQRVRFTGTLIHRRNIVMAEITNEASLEILGPAESLPESLNERLGDVVLRGQLVDTKCFFGVMNPGIEKVHRACAIRCVAGGIPPGLWIRGGKGDDVCFLVSGPPGQDLDLDVQFVGLEVEIQGSAEIHDGIPVLRASSIKPLE